LAVDGHEQPFSKRLPTTGGKTRCRLGVDLGLSFFKQNNMTKQKYTFGLEGSMHLLRAASEIQAEITEPFFDSGDWIYDHQFFEALPALHRSRNPTAFGGLDAALLVMTFISSCFAKKVFDEVYERTAKRPISAYLDKLFKTVKVPERKIFEYRDVIYLEDIDLVVVIRAIAAPDSTQSLQAQIMQAHHIAYRYIEQHGRQAPIHCHSILEGEILLEPQLFRTMEAIKQHDVAEIKKRKQWFLK
jgi:hypothetical protein